MPKLTSAYIHIIIMYAGTCFAMIRVSLKLCKPYLSSSFCVHQKVKSKHWIQHLYNLVNSSITPCIRHVLPHCLLTRVTRHDPLPNAEVRPTSIQSCENLLITATAQWSPMSPSARNKRIDVQKCTNCARIQTDARSTMSTDFVSGIGPDSLRRRCLFEFVFTPSRHFRLHVNASTTSTKTQGDQYKEEKWNPRSTFIHWTFLNEENNVEHQIDQ